MADPVKISPVPTVTGNSQWDTFIGYAATHVGVLTAGVSLAWMNAHGFDTKSLASTGLDMSVLITTTVSGFLLSGAAWAWGQWRTRKSQLAIAANTALAAITGQVPVGIAKNLTPAMAAAVQASPKANVAEVAPAPLK